MVIAEELAKELKEISIAEFFEKNKHLLGFDSRAKALLVCVKEACDNSIDAIEDYLFALVRKREELLKQRENKKGKELEQIEEEFKRVEEELANYKPEISVRIKEVRKGVYRVIVEDNGPGIVPEMVPPCFGKLLFGSRFHRLAQSVAGSERILVKVGGDVRSMRIKELVDKFLKGEGVADVRKWNLQIFAFNPTTLKISWKPIEYVYKHIPQEELYELVLESGRRIKVTPSHSIFILNVERATIEAKRTSEVKCGEWVVVARRLPSPSPSLTYLNIFDYLPPRALKESRWYAYGLSEEVFEEVEKACKKVKKGKREFYALKDWKIRSDYFKKLKKEGCLPARVVRYLNPKLGEKLKNSWMQTYKVGGEVFKFPIFIPINKAFARFLGLWIAEGSIDKRVVCLDFGAHEEELIEEAKEIAKRLFWREPLIHKERNKVRIRICSKILVEFLKGIGLKSGARNKNIPPLVFNFNKELRLEFLKALFDGGGCLHVTDRVAMLSYLTASKRLAEELLYLLLFDEVYPSFRKRRSSGYKRHSACYLIEIYGSELSKLDLIPPRGRCSKFDGIPSILIQRFPYKPSGRIPRAKVLDYIESSYVRELGCESPQLDGGKAIDLMNKLKRIIDSDLSFLRVVGIKRRKARGYVYDLSIPSWENFIAGSGIVCHNSRGQQGLGISCCVLYSQLTTGKPAKITSKIAPDKPAHEFELMIDIQRNEPLIISNREVEFAKPHGTRVELEMEGAYWKGGAPILEYLKRASIANPYLTIKFFGPNGERAIFKPASKQIPKEPVEIKPHPHGIEVGVLLRMLSSTARRTLLSFLQEEFCRVGAKSAREILRRAKLSIDRDPKGLSREEAEALLKAMQEVKLIAPPLDCLSPIGAQALKESLQSEFKPEFIEVVSRPPAVYRGLPFSVEAAIAYGGEIKDEKAKIIRYANKVPLMYQASFCAITKAIQSIDWSRYGIKAQAGIPQAPLVILVHVASVWIPFATESKHAIAEYPEMIREIRLALQECARGLRLHLSRKKKAERRAKRVRTFLRYAEEVASGLAKLTEEEEKRIKELIAELIERYEA